jgi:predicted amidophosphoribosyltransferase
MADPTHVPARIDRVGERVCDQCRAPFTPINDAHRFCSRACRQAAHRRRRDGGKITLELELDLVEVEALVIAARLLHPWQTDDKRRVREAFEQGLRDGVLRITPAGERDV